MRRGLNSVAAVESAIRRLKQAFHDRAPVFGNRRRFNLLLGLLTLGFEGKAGERVFAERIREHLRDKEGFASRQKMHNDPFGVRSLYS